MDRYRAQAETKPAPMRWPNDGESMHDYALYMRDLLVERGMVVPTYDHRGAVDLIRSLPASVLQDIVDEVTDMGPTPTPRQQWAAVELTRRGGQ